MKTIVFVHGYMNTGHVWTEWKDYFEKLGYDCHSPSWPYMEDTVENLRKNPHPKLSECSFNDVVQYYVNYIQTLDETPILMGHSLGGVIVQKLLELGYGQAAVCIHSGPPKGVLCFDKDFLWSNLQLTNPLSRNPLVLMPDKWYHRYVTNDLTFEQTQIYTKENCVPSSRKIAATIESIDFEKAHPPILFIAGSADKSQPPKINRTNVAKYKDPNSLVDFVEFPNRTHRVIQQDGWQEITQYISDWLTENVR